MVPVLNCATSGKYKRSLLFATAEDAVIRMQESYICARLRQGRGIQNRDAWRPCSKGQTQGQPPPRTNLNLKALREFEESLRSTARSCVEGVVAGNERQSRTSRQLYWPVRLETTVTVGAGPRGKVFELVRVLMLA